MNVNPLAVPAHDPGAPENALAIAWQGRLRALLKRMRKAGVRSGSVLSMLKIEVEAIEFPDGNLTRKRKAPQ